MILPLRLRRSLFSVVKSCRLPAVLSVALSLLGVAAPSSAAQKERIMIPIIFSTPDTGFAAGAAVIWVKPNPEAGENRNDTSRLFGFLTQKGQMMLAIGNSQYRDQGNLLLEPSVAFGKTVDTSHGIGSTTTADDEESYETEFVSLSLKTGWNVLPDSYLGPELILQSREYTDLTEAPGLKSVLSGRDEKADSLRIGAGIQLKRDTRDNSFYSTRGVYSKVSLRRYDEALGSDYNFNLFELEHRRFISLNDKDVLAVQALIKSATGDVPYDQLPSVGGAQSLRGVLQDRYRDDISLSTQLEWRRILTDRLGFAVFTGFGDVFPSTDEISADTMKYALGVGGRFAMGQQQRINLRLDLGYSDAVGDAEADGFNVYFQIGEAF